MGKYKAVVYFHGLERGIGIEPVKPSWKRRAASWIMEARQYIPKDIALNLDGFDLVFEYEKKKAKA